MKSRNRIPAILFALFIYTSAIPAAVSTQNRDVSFQVFYDQLSPYGQWINNTDYGYIWIPDVGPEFSPYSTNGHWVMTEYGWTWVSDYDWGWAPFHYGRWDYNNNWGWFWVPDNEWGPSWVIWRRGNGYYGWEPMRPGITISMSFGRGFNDIDRWIFVRDRDFDRPDLGRYYVSRRDNDMIIRNSTVINNTFVDNSRRVTYISGPRRDEVQRFTGRNISSIVIRDDDRPGQRLNNNQLQIYRPRVERIDNTRQRPAPSRIFDAKDVRPPSERNTNYNRNSIQQQKQIPQGRQQNDNRQQNQQRINQQNQQQINQQNQQQIIKQNQQQAKPTDQKQVIQQNQQQINQQNQQRINQQNQQQIIKQNQHQAKPPDQKQVIQQNQQQIKQQDRQQTDNRRQIQQQVKPPDQQQIKQQNQQQVKPPVQQQVKPPDQQQTQQQGQQQQKQTNVPRKDVKQNQVQSPRKAERQKKEAGKESDARKTNNANEKPNN